MRKTLTYDDINIEITGARPGEKKIEDLSLESEMLDNTKHEKIFVLNDPVINLKNFRKWKNENKIELRAHPVLIQENSYLANLKSVRNGIEVETDLLGTLHIAGSGAGQESTASGVVSDLVHLANSNINISQSIKKNKSDLIDFLSLSFQYYFYIKAEDIPGVMASITSMFAEKKVGIESIVQKEDLKENMVPIVLITDPFVESDHKDLVKNILNLDSVNEVRSIRIESD